MIVTTKPIKYTALQTNTPIESFVSNSQTTAFTYVHGAYNNTAQYLTTISNLDKFIKEVKGLKFIRSLPSLTDVTQVNKCKRVMIDYLNITRHNKVNHSVLDSLNTNINIENIQLNWSLKVAFHETILSFCDDSSLSETRILSFGTKLLYWLKQVENQIKTQEQHAKRVLFYGVAKEHELIFLKLLWKVGFHVLVLNPLHLTDETLRLVKRHCSYMALDTFLKDIPEYPKQEVFNEQENANSVALKLELQSNHSVQAPVKSYEQLALFAESVVMIRVKNEKGDTVGSGSGVVIQKDGYIITNLHVVNKGVYYEILFENDPNVYLTNRLVKYHTDYDLALLKVDLTCKAIRLSSVNLVRGQKIVSIGSPLGLFNTISEGIVSGFRQFDGLDMIQISAPISAGSSGGALLNMYGELVGITTAGFDDGQNLNLTVPSKYIKMIAGNIL